MLHMQFLSLAMELVNKSSDGNLILEEISGCLSDTFPDYCVDIYNAVEEAQEDGVITVWEVFKILTAVID